MLKCTVKTISMVIS